MKSIFIFSVTYSQPTFIAPQTVQSSEAGLAEALGLSARGAAPGSTFKKIQTKGNVTKYTQMIHGIPVYGTVLTAHKDAGR